MEFKIEKKKGHILVVHLKGRLVGEFQTIELNDQIDEQVENKYYRIIFELSKLEYINSSGLNFFLKMLTKVRKSGGEVLMTSLNDILNTLMVTTKLTSFFTITATLEEAFEHLEKEKINEA